MRGRKAKTDLINISELNDWIRKDINRSAAIKCQALISLKNNVSVTDVCKVLGVTRECIRLWRKTIEKDGPDGFVKYPKTGRHSGLTDEIKTLLKNTVIKSPEESGYKQAVWDGKLICRFLEEKRDIQISVRTSQNWLKKINFTRQKPRKKYEKGNIEEIEAFKKKVEEETLQLNENELIIFSDEAGINLDADLSKIWSPKGEQPEILTHSPFGRVNLTGFVCPARGELIINQILKGNSENFIKQLEMVSELYKNYKIKIYVDNAKWHKSKMVMNWLTSNDIITLDYLPKYAPNANPMERHWWYLRKRKTKNKVFDSKEDCMNSINEHLIEMNKEKIIKICQI